VAKCSTDHVREVIRTDYFNHSTEQTYVVWLYRFIIFHNQRHPKDIDFELDEIIIWSGTVFHRWVVSVYSGVKIMRSIRSMEPAWEKIARVKFELGEYLDDNRQPRPEYHLTKRECLYIATKFNDEARAKLILRWEQLETMKPDFSDPNVVLQLTQNWKDKQEKRVMAE